MKASIIFGAIIAMVANTFGQHTIVDNYQKPILDTSCFNKWERVNDPSISNDGKYFSCVVRHKIFGAPTAHIKSVDGAWTLKLPNVYSIAFTDDSRHAIFIVGQDSLCSLTLGSDDVKYIAQTSTFESVNIRKEQYLFFLTNAAKSAFVIKNIASGRENIYAGVTRYWFDNVSKRLLLSTPSDSNKIKLAIVSWGNVKIDSIYEGSPVNEVVFNKNGQEIAFITSGDETKIWKYKNGIIKGIELDSNLQKDLSGNYKISNLIGFSHDGKRLFINMEEQPVQRPKVAKSSVDIWSYNDKRLQSQQLIQLSANPEMIALGLVNKHYLSVIQLDSHKLIRLQQGEEEIRISPGYQTDEWALIIATNGGDKTEGHWNKSSKIRCYLVSTVTGKRELLPLYSPLISKHGMYVIGTDRDTYLAANNVLCYNIQTGKVKNLTENMPTLGNEQESYFRGLKERGIRQLAWLEKDESILVGDKYDIWQLDPKGIKTPICLTNEYGRRNHYRFKLLEQQEISSQVLKNNQELMVTVFDEHTKNFGFGKIKIGIQEIPKIFSIGPYLYNDLFNGVPPMKAKYNNRYIVERETASTSPNYYITSNFSEFSQLTYLEPEKKYNWLSSELITYKTLDGITTQGVLYKPENFNPNKQYPIIFHYYERMSENLNKYMVPEPVSDFINIPWFVSQGYLVFTPDIHYKLGEPGKSAFNSVVGAAKFLSRLLFVDTLRMGLQAHSFGSFETNYIVTHTNIFAAAVSSSGHSDQVNWYGTVHQRTGTGLQYLSEIGQARIGSSLWQSPELFILNSPIYNVDRVTTPLLTMSNKLDAIVPFWQGVEFFTALRRLGKRAWMLQYDGEPHSLINDQNKIDYTIRMNQFFDHYLKDRLAPKWMTRGIPAVDKGYTDGLELDYEIRTPGEGLLTPEESSKVRVLQNRNPISITLE